MLSNLEERALSTPLYSDKNSAYFGYVRREIEPLLPERVGRVLEIGCGAGATLAWLRSIRQVDFAAGIELVDEPANQATTVLDRVVIGNIETLCEGPALPFDRTSFDLILALDALEHLANPWNVVKRLHLLLKPGGSIIASIPNVAHFSVVLPLLVHGRWNYVREGLLDRTHLRFFVEQTAIELMTCSGLVVDKMDCIRLLPSWVKGRRATWYFMKFMMRSPLRHLIDFQFLIRASSVNPNP